MFYTMYLLFFGSLTHLQRLATPGARRGPRSRVGTRIRVTWGAFRVDGEVQSAAESS